MLQTSEDHSRKLESFLTRRTDKLTALLKDLSEQRTASNKEFVNQAFQIKAETMAVLLAQAGRAVRDELRALTETVLTGRISTNLFTPLHVGRVIAVSSTTENFTISMDVSKLQTARLNCTNAEDMTPVYLFW